MYQCELPGPGSEKNDVEFPRAFCVPGLFLCYAMKLYRRVCLLDNHIYNKIGLNLILYTMPNAYGRFFELKLNISE